MIKAVLFDLDGTLVDTAPDFITVVNRLRAEEGLNPLPEELIRSTVSHGARALITLAFELQQGQGRFEELRQRLLQLYSEHLAVYSQPFAGIRELLAELDQRQIAWGIVTNKPSLYAEPLIEALQFQPRAATLICPDHVSQTKPHPEPMLKACSEIPCEPQACIYVGDHHRDIEAGQRAGMATIAAAYGYVADDDAPEHWQADYIVHHAADILPCIERLLAKPKP